MSDYWEDERRVDELKRLWADGLSASQIARQMGGGVSRSSVIGKVWRLGLSDANRAHPSAPPQRAPRTSAGKVKPQPVVPGAAGYINRGTERSPPVPMPRFRPDPLAPTVTLLELGARMCRWPIGDPQAADFGFCGRSRPIGEPYCADHRRLSQRAAA